MANNLAVSFKLPIGAVDTLRSLLVEHYVYLCVTYEKQKQYHDSTSAMRVATESEEMKETQKKLWHWEQMARFFEIDLAKAGAQAKAAVEAMKGGAA